MIVSNNTLVPISLIPVLFVIPVRRFFIFSFYYIYYHICLTQYTGRCRGLRKIFRRFKTTEQAQLAHEILLSTSHHLIDPQRVEDGTMFEMTVEQYENLCSKEIKRSHLKLYRAKLGYTPSLVPPEQRPVPVDPYFLGLWLGDGTAAVPAITSSDREVSVWLQSYVDRLNRQRPIGARPLHLRESLVQRAGTEMKGNRSGYFANSDCFLYSIASKQGGEGYHWNPVRTGLEDLGLLGDKSTGIPAAYMQADEDTRLAVIAGMIDSDGCYVKSHNTYRFIQMTEEHTKIVYDLKELALSCGISVTGVDINEKERIDGLGPHTPVWICYLGKGSVKFQHHLLIPRKRMTFQQQYYTHDLRLFKVADVPDGQYRAIEVSGGKYQLHNRVVVENCHCQLTRTSLFI
jgi:hypothetical protein